MLKLKDVSKYYYQDGVIATGFSKVNLELFLGEFVVITGESGSGKSTLLNVLSGLDTYEDGEMFINGEETSHYTEDDYLEYRRKYVSNIFQNFNLVNSYTVYQNIELAMLMNGKNKKDVKKYINELINKVGLKKYRNTHVSKLSGGQKQRVAIARALANDTPIIVADEPTGALDSAASASILKLLHEISKDKLVIVVTHNKAEIEKYATRLIRMHDGKILENKVLTKINLDKDIKEKDVNDITFISKLRLGIRNAFNIPIKFILMFIIFMLITITLISNYGGFKISEYEELSNFNNFFDDSSDKRIVLNKKDKTPFTEEDYKLIEANKNIDYITKNDLINDYTLYINNNSNLYIDGKINRTKITKVDVGRLPNKDNEIVIIGHPDNWYLSDMQEELLNDTFTLDDIMIIDNLKVVGIIYDKNENDYSVKFSFTDNLLSKIEDNLNKNYIRISYQINKQYLNSEEIYLNIISSDKVAKGNVYLNENLNVYCKNNNCLNKTLTINTQNIYVDESRDYKIVKLYNKDNIKKLLDTKYNEDEYIVYLNNEDYQELFHQNNYQVSVYIKEIKDLDNTLEELNNLNYNTLSLRLSKSSETELALKIFRIFRLIVTIILVLTLFFITYFIMKIIYKSRNSYYTTLRTLGGTKQVCVSILMGELTTLAILTYSIFLIFIYLIKQNIINFEYFQTMTKYIGIEEYLLVFLILIILSVLMSLRYGRKIFKNSIIKTYGERI